LGVKFFSELEVYLFLVVVFVVLSILDARVMSHQIFHYTRKKGLPDMYNDIFSPFNSANKALFIALAAPY
jgi:hypothetical protein